MIRSWCSITVLAVLCLAGCSPRVAHRETERHEGPKVNIPDFIANTASYKGKTITLNLRLDEPLDKAKGKALVDLAGREVKFAISGPKGERASLLISIPAGMQVPNIETPEQLRVTFVCSRGNLRQGNDAKMIVRP